MASDLQSGTQLGHYRIERVIGRGGMGVVYLARDLGLDRYVALKILSPELAESDTFRDRFIRESRLAASLDHPNIIPIYEADEVDGVLFIAMRYVQGRDLRAILAEETRLDPQRAILQIGTQVARALDAAHLRGLVHRDVKPGNVLVTAEESEHQFHCYLADFGLTRQTSSLSTLTGEGQFVGTLSYIAPEQIQDHGVDGRSDQYALAAVLFECLAGRPPFVKDNDAAMIYAHLEEPPPRLSAIGWDLPEALDGVFVRGLAKEKQDRFETCGQLIGAAREAAGFGPPSGTYPIPGPVGDRTTVTADRPSASRGVQSGPHALAPSGPWRRKSLARNPATWWTAGVTAVVITALVLFFVIGGGGGSTGRGHPGPPPASVLYTMDTGVGAGGSPSSAHPADGVRGTATSPAWADEQTIALVERSTNGTHIDVASLRNKGNVRVLHQIKLTGTISHLTWSPDQTRIVFVRSVAGHSTIQSIGKAGGGQRSLADLAVGARDPAYAPNDGRVIAFEGSRGGSYQIWTMTQNGENQQQRTDQRGGCSNPAWSADGHHLAYVGKVGVVNQLFVMSRNGKHQRQLTDVKTGLSDPAWSRDGQRVFFVQNLPTGGRRLASVDVKTRKVKSLTDGMEAISAPMVAPTGDIIFFVATQDGVQQLFELRLTADQAPAAISALPGGAYQPALSPGGGTMAFVSRTAHASTSPGTPSA
jgi:serine/threonine protein kinase